MSDEPEEGRDGEHGRNVRMTPHLMQMLMEAAQAAGNSIDWGEPDSEGFYVPIIGIKRWRVLSAHYPTLSVPRGFTA